MPSADPRAATHGDLCSRVPTPGGRLSVAGVHTETVPLFASQQSEAWLPGPTQLPRATPRPELDFPRPSRGGGESDMAGEGWHTAQQPRLYPPVSGLARPPSLGRPPWGCTRVEVAMSLPEAQVQAPGPAQILKCNFTQFFATHTHTHRGQGSLLAGRQWGPCHGQHWSLPPQATDHVSRQPCPRERGPSCHTPFAKSP